MCIFLKHSIKYLILVLYSLLFVQVNAQVRKGEWVTLSNVNCKYFEPYYEPGFTATWSGECMDGVANGSGILKKYINGTLNGTYEGPIDKGHIQGKGKYTNKNGEIMEGLFDDGELNGQGTRSGKNINGLYNYTGNLVHYYMHGDGKMEYPNGEFFEGKFNMNRPYTGIYTTIKGEKKYFERGIPVNKLSNQTSSSYNPPIGTQQKEFFDENWVRCDKNKAKYYRLITYKSPQWPDNKVVDYYISGKIQSIFYPIYIDFDDDYMIFCEGEALFYHENGQISQKSVRYGTSFRDTTLMYNENGNRIGEIIYETPGGASQTIVYDNTGNKVRSFKSDEYGNLIGNVKEYESDGSEVEVKSWYFAGEPSNWVSSDDDSKSYIDKKGNLRLETKKNGFTYSRRVKFSIDQTKDYMIESIVEQVDANDEKPYGIIFGFKDWDNYFKFLISGNQYYGFFATSKGIENSIIPFKRSTAINFGDSSNRIQIWKRGNEFYFAINGTLVDKCDAYRFEGDEMGFAVIGKGEFSIDNLIVRQYSKSTPTDQKQSVSQQESSTTASNQSSRDEISIDGSGTGFFIDKRGYLATNYHVTKDSKNIFVCIQKEGVWESYHAIIVKSDPTNDLSIIRIDDPAYEQFASLPYNFVTDVEDIAADIYTLGYPQVHVMGSDVKYTAGSINSKTGFQGDPTHYQISAHIDHGNSGGPMFNAKGAIVGITDGGLDKAKFGDVNYAIKSSYLKSLVDALPIKLNLPSDKSIESLSRVEQIKVLSKYTALLLIDLP